MGTGITRRSWLRFFGGSVVAAAGVALAACGGAANAPATATTGASPATASPATSTVASSSAATTLGGSSSAVTTASAGSSTSVAATASSLSATVTSTAAVKPAPGGIAWAINFDSGPRHDYVLKVLAQFQRENPTITVDFLPVAPADFYNKMFTLVASGTAPDIMHGSGAFFLNFAEKGALGTVDDYLKADKVDLNAYYKQADIFSWQGKQYGMPFMENVTICVYNKTLFQSASVAAPTEQWTWDDALQAAQKLTKPGQFGLRVSDGFEFNWLVFIWSNGGEYLSKDLKKTMLAMPETVAAFQWLVDLKLKYKVSPAEGDTSLGKGDPFMDGKLAMITSGTGSVGNWLTGIKQFEWDFFPVPLAPKTGKRVVSSNGNPELLMKQSKRPDQAWLLLKYTAGPVSQGLIGDMKIAMPTLIAKATDAKSYLQAPPANMALTDEDMKVSRDLQFHKNWLDWYNQITTEMLPAFKGEMSVADAARQADQIGDSVLAKN